MDFTAIKCSGQGSFKVKKGTIDKTFTFTENHWHLPIASVNDPSLPVWFTFKNISLNHCLLVPSADNLCNSLDGVGGAGGQNLFFLFFSFIESFVCEEQVLFTGDFLSVT